MSRFSFTYTYAMLVDKDGHFAPAIGDVPALESKRFCIILTCM